MKEGMKPKKKRVGAAMLEVGGVEQVKEEVRANRAGFQSGYTLFQDLRYGFRSLRKKPGFTATVIAARARHRRKHRIFSVTNASCCVPIAYRDPGSIVMAVGTKSSRGTPPRIPFRRRTFRLKKQCAHLRKSPPVGTHASTDEWRRAGGNPDPEGLSRFLSCARRSSPSWVRAFVRAEETPGTEPVVILGHDSMATAFRGNRAIIARP